MTHHTHEAHQASGTRTLVADVLGHLTSLIRGEVDLARAEMSESLKGAGTAVGMIVGGAVVAITALNVLAAALVGALTEAGLDAAWSALIVGVVLALAAYLLVRKGMGDLSLSSFAPRRTARNIRRDAHVLRETYNEQ